MGRKNKTRKWVQVTVWTASGNLCSVQVHCVSPVLGWRGRGGGVDLVKPDTCFQMWLAQDWILRNNWCTGLGAATWMNHQRDRQKSAPVYPCEELSLHHSLSPVVINLGCQTEETENHFWQIIVNSFTHSIQNYEN